jgi:predicted DNA-binding transcriptional regulator AlpA
MAQSNLYITTRQAAEHLGVSTSWLEKLRVYGSGPPYFKPSERRILYRRDEIEAWISSSRRTSTSDHGQALEVGK